MSEEKSGRPFEIRPGWAHCFKPKNAKSAMDYTGVTVLDDDKKYWVNIYLKSDRNGNPFCSVNIKPMDPPQAKQAEPRPKPIKENRRHGQWIP